MGLNEAEGKYPAKTGNGLHSWSLCAQSEGTQKPRSSAHAQKMMTAENREYLTRANPYSMLIQCRCPAKRFLMITHKIYYYPEETEAQGNKAIGPKSPSHSWANPGLKPSWVGSGPAGSTAQLTHTGQPGFCPNKPEPPPCRARNLMLPGGRGKALSGLCPGGRGGCPAA